MRTLTKMTGSRTRWASMFYWIGVVMTATTIALVLLGNTAWGAKVEHTNFPLAWKFAIAAVLAFLVGELSRPTLPFRRDSREDSRHSLDHTPYEV
jgi:hypothetical protein